MSIYDDGRGRPELGTIALAIATILIAALVAWGLVFSQRNKIEISAKDLCPINGAVAQTILLIDVSNPLSELQWEGVDQLFEDFKDTDLRIDAMSNLPGFVDRTSRYIEKYEKVVIYRMGEEKNGLAELILSMCNPGNPSQRVWKDDLFSAVAIAAKRYDGFEENLRQALRSVPLSQEQDSSPILESIALVAERHVSLAAKFDPLSAVPTRLIVISDFLQNTDAVSHFRSIPSWPETAERIPGLEGILKGVEVDLVFLRRPNWSNFQTDLFFDWWPEVIKKMNGELVLEDAI